MLCITNITLRIYWDMLAKIRKYNFNPIDFNEIFEGKRNIEASKYFVELSNNSSIQCVFHIEIAHRNIF